MRKCKYCESEFVCWNAFGPFKFWKTWTYNTYRNPQWWQLKFWKYFDRWSHECWNCNRGCGSTFFKVKDGLTYEQLKEQFVWKPKHEINSLDEELWYLTSTAHKWLWSDLKYAERVHILCDELKKSLMEHWEDTKEVRDKGNEQYIPLMKKHETDTPLVAMLVESAESARREEENKVS